MASPALIAAFIGTVPDPLRAGLADDEPAIAAALDRAAAAWPAFGLDTEAFAAHLGGAAARWVSDAGDLARLRADEVGLAYACTRGASDAVTALIDRYRSEVIAVCRWAGADAALAEELWNEILTDVTTPLAAGASGLAGYSGRGSLRGWLRAVAVRRVIRARSRRDAGEVDWDQLPAVADDPLLRQVDARYRGEVEAALREAIDELEPRDKTLLRQHHIFGLSIDKLGAIYGVHRATAARWVATARERVLDGCLARLAARLAVSPAEAGSIIRLVRSRLDVSVGRHLGGDDA